MLRYRWSLAALLFITAASLFAGVQYVDERAAALPPLRWQADNAASDGVVVGDSPEGAFWFVHVRHALAVLPRRMLTPRVAGERSSSERVS